MTAGEAREALAVTTAEQLRTALLELDAVRLVGGGSAQSMLPVPDGPVTRLSTGEMRRILRLEADDLTCSVEPGVPRAELDAALAEHGLWLPCRGGGTVGGLFAGDLWGPAALGQPEPRSLLLGLSGVLGDGTRFKTGARVVKNVAGFDLAKLFVGSRGRLFAATELHLKLRPRPAAARHFARPGLDQDEAIALVRTLRRARTPPQALCLRRDAAGYAVTGSVAGAPDYLERWLAEHRLEARAEPPADLPAPATRLESVRGQAPLRALPELLARLPADAPFVLHGARFWTHLPPAATDALLQALPALTTAEIGHGAADRRGRTAAAPADRGARRLEADLARALDPGGVLR